MCTPSTSRDTGKQTTSWCSHQPQRIQLSAPPMTVFPKPPQGKNWKKKTHAVFLELLPRSGSHLMWHLSPETTPPPTTTLDGTHSLPQSRRAVMWRFTSFIRSWVRWPTSTCRRRSRISFMMCHSRWKRSPSFLWEVPKHGSSGQSPEWVVREPRRKGKDQSSLPSMCSPLCGQILCEWVPLPSRSRMPAAPYALIQVHNTALQESNFPFQKSSPRLHTRSLHTLPPPPPQSLLSLAPSTLYCPLRLHLNPPVRNLPWWRSPHSFLSSQQWLHTIKANSTENYCFLITSHMLALLLYCISRHKLATQRTLRPTHC